MKIAIGQIGTDADKTANFALVAQAVITAAMNHARLILFPEATCGPSAPVDSMK